MAKKKEIETKQAKGKEGALNSALSEITKRFGDGAIMRMGEAKHMQIDIVPTGCLSLDLALGIGGIPRGRVIEIYGPESSGKTTICQLLEKQRNPLLHMPRL